MDGDYYSFSEFFVSLLDRQHLVTSGKNIPASLLTNHYLTNYVIILNKVTTSHLKTEDEFCEL